MEKTKTKFQKYLNDFIDIVSRISIFLKYVSEKIDFLTKLIFQEHIQKE